MLALVPEPWRKTILGFILKAGFPLLGVVMIGLVAAIDDRLLFAVMDLAGDD